VITGMGTSVAALGTVIGRFAGDYRSQPRRVLTFALGGKAKLPPFEPPKLPPVEDPDFRTDAALEQRGALVYGLNCSGCHGGFAVSAGVAPDLRHSPIPVSMEAFTSVVRDGALLGNGMPRFPELSEEERSAIRQYIRARGAASRKSGT
jgi:quinohemoprotein ethanol dehydrogenase